MSFCGLKPILCGTTNTKNNNRHLNINDKYLKQSKEDSFKEESKSKEILNMSKNACIIDNECDLIVNQLKHSSMSKCANIPMIVIHSYTPQPNINTHLPKVTQAGIRLFTRVAKTHLKQLEIHRGMTVNALFLRQQWLYVRTATGDEGYVPLETCRSVTKRDKTDETMNQTQDTTNVSLFDVSQKEESSYGMIFECENLSELELSMYESPESENYVRSYKIRNYLQSLDSLAETVSIASSKALDSGYSDTDSVTNFQYSKVLSQSAELLNIKQRRGIKTNGSICSISPKPAPPAQEQTQNKPQSKRNNLSTIIEQSYNTSISASKLMSNESSIEHQRLYNCQNNTMSSVSERCEQDRSMLVRLDDLAISKMSTTTSTQSNMLMIVQEYCAQFVEDLSVERGESVTILDDSNQEWLYVVSSNGKGYVPRSSVCL